MAIESVPYVVSDFSFKPWYLLFDYGIWALMIFVICLFIRFKKPKMKNFATFVMVLAVIITIQMRFYWHFSYISHSCLDGRKYFDRMNAVLGLIMFFIGILLGSLIYLIIKKIVNYKSK